jgi:hypothetical protein
MDLLGFEPRMLGSKPRVLTTTLQVRHNYLYRKEIFYKCFSNASVYMPTVGFEPTQLSLGDLKSPPLDLSGKLAIAHSGS